MALSRGGIVTSATVKQQTLATLARKDGEVAEDGDERNLEGEE